jgi:hypothetical protein
MLDRAVHVCHAMPCLCHLGSRGLTKDTKDIDDDGFPQRGRDDRKVRDVDCNCIITSMKDREFRPNSFAASSLRNGDGGIVLRKDCVSSRSPL